MTDRAAGKLDFDVVALSASAGGLSALSHVLSALPGDFPVPIVVVQHLDPDRRSRLAEILGRRTTLRVKEAAEGDALHPGTVYIAPSNRHLLVKPDATLTLSGSKPVHFVRPSADLLFGSVADSFGGRAIAVVLTGAGRDGVQGCIDVNREGGTVIAQDKETSESFGMPGGAIRSGSARQVLPLDEIAPALVALVAARGAS
jgi:two-component system chemotaxis response regulator CheB